MFDEMSRRDGLVTYNARIGGSGIRAPRPPGATALHWSSSWNAVLSLFAWASDDRMAGELAWLSSGRARAWHRDSDEALVHLCVAFALPRRMGSSKRCPLIPTASSWRSCYEPPEPWGTLNS
ncbi:hypothetical protein PR202_gb19381 [Eleusine coracana subsp. coracana]|uniref:Uncharacterized protein n=1 Tax=Eleusine coracana subsp. coracana TaxID=191504 RepID=A0AAV5F8P5_ELECO|nr:hypothetical protein PR202_gb19381 [Eleusine coracana subsp. coracana]